MIKTIFVLESSWDHDKPLKNASVMPFVSEFAKQRKIEAYHQVFTDRNSFCHWINEFNKAKSSSALLYIAAHGNAGSLSTLNGSIKKTTILNAIKGTKYIKFIHFGSCLFGNRNNLEIILKKSNGVKWAAGYNKPVDWVTSTLFDILLWSRIHMREVHEKNKKTQSIVRDISENQAAGLASELGFEFVYKNGKKVYSGNRQISAK